MPITGASGIIGADNTPAAGTGCAFSLHQQDVTHQHLQRAQSLWLLVVVDLYRWRWAFVVL